MDEYPPNADPENADLTGADVTDADANGDEEPPADANGEALVEYAPKVDCGFLAAGAGTAVSTGPEGGGYTISPAQVV